LTIRAIISSINFYLPPRELLPRFNNNNNNNNASGRVFFSKLGRKLADQSGDDREISFLFQRLSVLIQRYNAMTVL